MTSGNPKLISFIGSITLSLITAVVLMIINSVPDAFSSINNIVIVAFVVFVVSFVITWIIIEVFIYRKIKSIHETLNKFRTQKDILIPSGNGELLNDIVKEV